MRFIAKGAEPELLREFKEMANPPDWEPSYDALPKFRKDAIKRSLIEEQKGLCCYCERTIDETDSHIEHFKPQHGYAEYALDYGNMHCSCMSEQKKGEPLHCGMAKKDWYDDDLLISPLDPNCESHFVYHGDGRISPASQEDAAAAATIGHLRLDDGELTAERKAVIEVFLDEALSEEERDRFLSEYLSECGPNPSPFISAVKSVFGSAQD